MSNDQPPYRTGDDAWPAGPAGRGGAGKAPDGWGSGSGWGPQGAERGFGRPDEPTIVLPPGYQPPPGDTYAPLPPPELPGAPTTVLPKAEGQRKRGVSRRTVLIGAGVGAVGVGALGAGVGLLLARNNGGSGAANLMTDEAGKVGHLLRRAGFGAAPWDVADYVNAGVDGAIERLLNYQNIPDDLDARLQSLNLDFSKPADMVRWFMLRALYSKHPLEEKMTLFWHGVLTSSITKIGGKEGYPLLVQQNKLLRAHALGRFDDLIRAITTDPAMLWWLDGRLSTGHAPNENYGRELMELFTLGIINAQGQPNYTQDDVHQMALALTGWTIRKGDGQSVFVPSRHYGGSVTVLGHTGPMGVDDVVKLVCAHPATPRHLAWRLWNFFVYELEQGANPTPAGLSAPELQPLVDAYNNSDHSIAAMVKAMLTSPAFFGEKAYRARVKSPIEFVAGAVRGLSVVSNGQNLAAVMQYLGQVPFAPPDVSGWDGDKVSAAWVSTQTWMARCNFVNSLLAAVAGPKVNLANSPLQALLTNQGLTTPDDVANYFVAALLDNHLDADRRAVLHEAITAQAAGPAFVLKGGAKLPAASLRNCLYLLMSMPEYQMN